MRAPTINRRSWLRILFGVYLFPLFLFSFSLSVPPGDLPICAMMFVIAVLGLILARREHHTWLRIWALALIVSLLCTASEIIAGRRIALECSRNALGITRPTP